MPPRRKPASSKQKKAALQEKRAVKRGDLPAPESSSSKPHKKARRGPPGRSLQADPSTAANIDSARKLQSAFVKVSAEFLEETKILASNVPLPRPLPPQASIFPFELDIPTDQIPKGQVAQLSAPKRPKWRFDMSKKEVEKNEEGIFKKWLAQADAIVDDWRHSETRKAPASDAEASSADTTGGNEEASPTGTPPPAIPRAPAHFERNLEVWRQLWRVAEISQILLILLDARCASLHFPPALSAYLESLQNRRLVLVLTKADITGADHAQAWAEHLAARHPHVRIVMVEAYAPLSTGKHSREPHLPRPFRASLVNTLREIHEEMLQPPERVRLDPVKLARWKPSIKPVVDWEAVMNASGGHVGKAVGGAIAPYPPANDLGSEGGSEEDHEQAEPEYLTIGLIGQPNVGKSSLLNAIFGVTKVRASSTPGKTKHFQTLFWTPEVRLVDCPGLVVPNLVPMELQVLSGILPISRVSAVPACIHYAANILPLERILKLEHPSALEAPTEDKRTWREGHGTSSRAGASKSLEWTAMDILTAYANKKGWFTAKAGRPDVNRAGNAILRALADGHIRWAFWPPGTHVDATADAGILIDAASDHLDIAMVYDEDSASDGEASIRPDSDDVGEEDEDDEDEGEDDENNVAGTGETPSFSMFSALKVDDVEDEEDEED